MTWRLSVFSALSLGAAMLFIAGCGSNFNSSSGTPTQTSVGAIQGNLHGGQQGVVGAKVYLFATGTGGPAGNGVTASSANESFSLLTSSGNTSFDGANYYVVTSAGGSFSITGDYHCTAGSQVYLYAVGGDAGTGENSAAGFLAGLGTCPAAQNFATLVPFVYMDEISTVVTAYALAGFASDATHISIDTTGTGPAATGIANAMGTVANLTDIATGLTYATTHATGSSGTVPQDMINAIADILAACINSNVSTSSSCSTLLSDDRSGGGKTGTQATDTATAAIYLAQHPYSSYVGTLFGLIAGTAKPFPTALTSAPDNYVLAVTYTGNGVTRTPNDAGYPDSVAIDGLGQVWVTNYSTSTVSAFSNLGVPLSGSPFSGNGLHTPQGVSVDVNDRIWIANAYTNSANHESLSIFNDNGSAYADPIDNGSGCLNDPGYVAFDPSGNAWLGVIGGYSLCKMNSTVTTYTIIGGSSLLNPTGLASDSSGNMWVTNSEQPNAAQVNKFSPSGANISGSPFQASQIGLTYGIAIDANNNAWVASFSNMLEITSGGAIGSAITGSGIIEPNSVAVDGANNIWEADYGTYNSTTNQANGNGAVIELNSSGAAISGATGYQASTTFAGQGIAIDGSGNVWIDNLAANSVRELIGAAAPVVTPLSLAVKNGQLGVRP